LKQSPRENIPTVATSEEEDKTRLQLNFFHHHDAKSNFSHLNALLNFTHYGMHELVCLQWLVTD
jgi:hypothetical protein